MEGLSQYSSNLLLRITDSSREIDQLKSPHPDVEVNWIAGSRENGDDVLRPVVDGPEEFIFYPFGLQRFRRHGDQKPLTLLQARQDAPFPDGC